MVFNQHLLAVDFILSVKFKLCLFWIKHYNPDMCKNMRWTWTVNSFFFINRLSFWTLGKRDVNVFLCLVAFPWQFLRNKSHNFYNFDKLHMQFEGVSSAGVKIFGGNSGQISTMTTSLRWVDTPLSLTCKKTEQEEALNLTLLSQPEGSSAVWAQRRILLT